ncbi:hypothetical protein R1sor_015166 [Riccia sorocarpa]|uniref:Alpha-1,3-mannosyl-glycoprotein 2-beta-N-acetylglucosaminyltransferase n=1 Tax=Riccia sorocarpa TaxID=122646 RepID=A0ABD3HEH6_9MARC
MSRPWVGSKFLFGIAALFFLFVQIKIFMNQSQYAEQVAASIKSQEECTSRSTKLLDQLTTYHGKVISLQEEKNELARNNQFLSTVIDDLKRNEKVEKPSLDDDGKSVAAVVIMACNRPDYLERTIKSVLRHHGPVASKFPLFISQDGSFLGVETLAKHYPEFHLMQHLNFEKPKSVRPGELIAYYKISSHYKWALQQLFGERKYRRVIILEDDMEIAPDFFDYFEAMAPLLDQDSSLMAASSWNDNGQRNFVHDSELLYRSDFFPGLGWMLNKKIWEELAPKWPAAYPFLGSSMGQFFKQYLEPIKLNDQPVDWKNQNLTYLFEPNYSVELGALLSRAAPISPSNALQEATRVDGDVRVEYTSQTEFGHLAATFGVFQEWKDGVPRTAYKGVVVFRWHGPKRVFFVSSDSPLIRDR